MDVIGVVLALVGFLSILALISKQNSVLTGWWVTALKQMAGWGAFLLPAGLFLLGLWLLLRNVESFPSPSGVRIAGLVLLFLNVVTILHLANGGGWELAEAGGGGGFLGGAFERLLVDSLGTAGAVVVVTGWLLVALALTLDISIADIFAFFQRMAESLRNRWQAERELTATRRETPVSLSPGQMEEENWVAAPGELPPDFRPLPRRNGAPAPAGPRQVGGGNVARGQNAPASGGSERAAHPRSSANPAASGAPQTPSVAPAWVLPTIAEILDPPTIESVRTNVEHERAKLIEDTLASFGAPVHVVEVHRGPTVTQYGVEPDFIETRNGRTRVRVGKIAALVDDLALALAAQRIRIQAPVPGRSYVGIEVPNAEVTRVMLREVIESEGFQKLRSPLRFALGKDVAGKSISYDLASMPHLLVAGTTGSGKSVLVNAILSCFLLNNSPADLRMILVDPKRVELTGYNGIPHLLAPVIVEAEKVVGALQWVQREMDARYHRFSQLGVRNIQEHNKKQSPPLPYLLVLVDELADLMMLAPDETERSLTRLAQLARATGIHLVLATQRPSVDVVTGLIKANFPARVAFAVASGIDSRVILDQPGAERLLGRGDMLFQAPDSAAPVRLQGVFVSDPEIQRTVDYWRVQDMNIRAARAGLPVGTSMAEPVNMDVPLSTPMHQGPLWDEEVGGKPEDPIMEKAVALVRQEGKASISMLQRKLGIGYTRAARLVDAMEDKGVVGPAQATSQMRVVLPEDE
ncbi:MAG: DNA translocase FtsK [Anaerolineaceae bacterium]|nr:DNA translocase FtsK [Anaerolineaceae bacterium]